MKSDIQIVVPIYKPYLSELEQISLKSCFRVFKDYKIILCKPENINTTSLECDFPFFGTETFDDAFFSSINAYNRLMLSPIFYERFIHTKYILICQPDVFVFHDDLDKWLLADYDYVGAPWITNSFLSSWLSYIKMIFKDKIFREKRLVYPYERKNNIGNGGFSLRKTQKHLDICIKLEDEIKQFLESQNKLFNEDVFFSIVAEKNGYPLKKPTTEEAKYFAFDEKPQLLYKKTKRQFPMAAHGWLKPKHIKFWLPLIKKIL
jgi:hypothetical protein